MTGIWNGHTLPNGWQWAELGTICLIQGGYAFKSSDYVDSGVRLLRISNIKELGVNFENKQSVYLHESNYDEYKEYALAKGDIVVALSGATTGKYGLFNFNVPALLNQRVGRIKCFGLDLTDTRYIFHYMDVLRKRILDEAYGAAQPNISPTTLARFLIPLAPLNEQHRIVDAVETQFTRLDAAVSALKRTQANLKRYRAAVLKAACEGRLVSTEAELARAEGRSYEPASALLACILAERRRKWEVENPKKKYKEPVAPDTSDLSSLPEGWSWITIEQLAAHEQNAITDGPFGSKLKTSHYTESGPRVIRLQNIGDGIFHDEYAHISKEHFSSLSKHQVFAGDIVIAALGADLPRACIIPDNVGLAIVKADCMRFKPHSKLINAAYARVALNSQTVRAVASRIVHGIGRPRLNQQEVKNLVIPLPPLAEQQRIVAEVERRLSIADQLAKTIEADLARAERLRQSILKRAFEGKLVPQDPNDEPASVLLARIQAERNGPSIANKIS